MPAATLPALIDFFCIANSSRGVQKSCHLLSAEHGPYIASAHLPRPACQEGVQTERFRDTVLVCKRPALLSAFSPLATRYDTRGHNFLSAAMLAAIMLWLL